MAYNQLCPEKGSYSYVDGSSKCHWIYYTYKYSVWPWHYWHWKLFSKANKKKFKIQKINWATQKKEIIKLNFVRIFTWNSFQKLCFWNNKLLMIIKFLSAHCALLLEKIFIYSKGHTPTTTTAPMTMKFPMNFTCARYLRTHKWMPI